LATKSLKQEILSVQSFAFSRMFEEQTYVPNKRHAFTLSLLKAIFMLNYKQCPVFK